MVLLEQFNSAAAEGTDVGLPYVLDFATNTWKDVRPPDAISPSKDSDNISANDSPPFELPTGPITRTNSPVAFVIKNQYGSVMDMKPPSAQTDLERVKRWAAGISLIHDAKGTPKPIMSRLELLVHEQAPLSLYLAGHGSYPVAEAGGMYTEVYRAFLRSSEPVALKCVRTCMNDDIEKVHKRFMREVLMWSRLDHPNILDVYGLGNVHGRLAMVSPWMGHGSIQEYITRKPNIDRWDLCQKITAGLRYLHDNQVVHGDLKAYQANILVSNDDVPKIADFGCLRLFEEMFPSSLALLNGESVRWKAPELIIIEDFVPDVSMAADIYALGMTMLEVMTSRKPFYEYKSNTYVALAVAEGIHPTQPPELSNASKSANEQWDLMTRCWAFQPDRRPSARTILELMSNHYYEAHEFLRTQT
ncbi:Tyrosine kinase domain protein [Ceratobasidium sp. AG-Ba]|nr:Tyrosine kinase domain protein [Ceratobasidium sp. AG-Ba]